MTKATCSFSPDATVTPGATSATRTLNIQTTESKTASALHRFNTLWFYAMLLPCAGFAMASGRRFGRTRSGCRLLVWLGVICIVLVTGTLVGCRFDPQSAGSSTVTIPGTPAGSYSIMVGATARGITHTTTVNVVVTGS